MISKSTLATIRSSNNLVAKASTSSPSVPLAWTTLWPYCLFTLGTTGVDYALAVLPKDRPAGMYPGPLNAGDDRAIDNDMRADLWVTNGFQMSETETVTGIDIGLCQ